MENRKISKIIEEVNEVVSSMTPAKKYISGKKLNAKTQKALSDIEKNHNTSWAVEIFRRNQENLYHCYIEEIKFLMKRCLQKRMIMQNH